MRVRVRILELERRIQTLGDKIDVRATHQIPVLVVDHYFYVLAKLKYMRVLRNILKELQRVHVTIASTLCNMQLQSRRVLLIELFSNVTLCGIAQRDRRRVKSCGLHG